MSLNQNKKILFCVNGLGLGNASRVQAIIDELNKGPKKSNISILATDLAIDFFTSESPHLKRFRYHSKYRKKPSLLSFLKDIYSLNAKIHRIVEENEIDVVISNSTYPFFLSHKTKFIALNNSHSNWKYIHKAFLNSSLKSYMVEFFDFLYHQLVPDKTLYIDLRCNLTIGNIIPPIAREVTPKVTKYKILLLPGGGQQFNHSLLKHLPRNYQYVIYGHHQETPGLDIEIRKSSYRVFEDLETFKLIICSGGLSSISEVLASSRPAIVIPQKNHHEQYMNAYHLCKNSKTHKLIDRDKVDELPEVISKLTSMKTNRDSGHKKPSGAKAVIENILL